MRFAFLAFALLIAGCANANHHPTDLDAAIQRFDDSASRVTYRIESTQPGAQPLGPGKQVAFKSGRNLRRLDVYTEEPDVKLRETDLVRGAEILRCYPGVDKTGACTHTDPASAQTGPTGDWLRLVLQNARNSPPPAPVIAGETADCYEATTDGVKTEACFGVDGTILRYRFGKGDWSASWEATEVSCDIHDVDFALPYSLDDSNTDPITITTD